jgi:hypothetical protein
MKTLNNFYTQCYSSIRFKSKRRGEDYPNFSKKELINWLLKNGIENKWILYIESGYDKNLKPSIDRINDYGIYEFSNMQLLTWRENLIKGVNGEKHNKNCINKQNMKKVNLVKSINDKCSIEFNSLIDCANWLGVHKVSVSRVLCGNRKTIKGYKVIQL